MGSYKERHQLANIRGRKEDGVSNDFIVLRVPLCTDTGYYLILNTVLTNQYSTSLLQMYFLNSVLSPYNWYMTGQFGCQIRIQKCQNYEIHPQFYRVAILFFANQCVISLYSINCLTFITEKCVYCAVRTASCFIYDSG